MNEILNYFLIFNSSTASGHIFAVDLLGSFLSTEWSNDTIASLTSSLTIMLIMMILAVIVSIKARKYDPLKKPHGLIGLFEIGVSSFDGLVDDLMGPRFKGFGGYIFALSVYLFVAFIWGLTGLPGPVTNLAIPLSLGISTFILIHATAIRFNRFKYFGRFVKPFAVFLPVNLLSMWAPLLSLTFRLFGNALAGWTLMSVIYYFFESVSGMIFSFLPSGFNTLFIAPIITPILHAYFDLFSGVIQTIIFIMLTMMFIGNEQPDEEEMKQMLTV
jgi:F-type H+-transporting ATPase subunit a